MSPTVGIAYDDRGQPVPVVGFDWNAVDGEADLDGEDARRLSAETLTRFITLVTAHTAKPDRIGKRVLLVGYLLHAPGTPRTQAALGRMLGISRAAVTQNLNTLRAELAAMTRDS